MKISIVASGTRGDVQPYVALGVGLKAAGYTIEVVTSDDFEALVRHAGLTFRSTGVGVEARLQSPEWRRVTEGGNFLAILAKMNAEMQIHARQLAEQLPACLDGTDLIMGGLGGIGAFSYAEHHQIPIVQAYVFPITPTRAFASPLMPFDDMGGLFNPLSFHVMQQLLWQSSRTVDMLLRQALGMRSASRWGYFQQLKAKHVPLLYGFSRHVIPPPADWSGEQQVTGYWFLDSEPNWTPPQDLLDFLAAGDAPVYIGFGSMGNRNPQATADLTLAALSKSGQRGVLAAGWGGLQPDSLPEHVYMLKSAPHSWLFPRMAAVVHHGGAGTTAAGLRAGVPSIIIPFMGDQPFWGRRVATLGVGPAPIPRKQLTAERLGDAIKRAVADEAMKQRAARLGEQIQTEDSITHVKQVLASFIGA